MRLLQIWIDFSVLPTIFLCIGISQIRSQPFRLASDLSSKATVFLEVFFLTIDPPISVSIEKRCHSLYLSQMGVKLNFISECYEFLLIFVRSKTSVPYDIMEDGTFNICSFIPPIPVARLACFNLQWMTSRCLLLLQHI